MPAFDRDLLLEYSRGPKNELRRVLAEARSFKGPEDQFAETIGQFESTWPPHQAATTRATHPAASAEG